jgi:hypothetical protein
MCLLGVFSCRFTFWYILGRSRLHISGAIFVHIIRQREKCLIICLRHSVISKYIIFKIQIMYGSDNPFLGAFAKLQKKTIVRLSVRPHGTTRLPLDGFFIKFDICLFFLKCVEKIQVSF